MPVPKVAIVGRPNVGKSSLLNWLAGKRIAIVEPTAGVTRDRVAYLLESGGRYVELVDTGGMGNVDVDGLSDDVERQISIAMDEAALILFVLDAQTGLVDEDRRVARRLRDVGRPVLHVANKCDNEMLAMQASEFYKLAPDLLFVSVTANRERDELLRAVFDRTPVETEGDDRSVALKLAVVGKRNAGKSTFINALAQSERMIVSEVPGTTRDSVDVRFEHNGRVMLAIDTAGVRKKKSLADSIEFYGFARAQRSIRRADVVFHLIDASVPLSSVDKQLSNYVLSQHKPCVFVVNKWDLVKTRTSTEAFNEYLNAEYPDLSFAPRVFITAKTGKNVHPLVDVAQSLYKQATARVTTGELNRIVAAATAAQPPPMRQNRRLKIFYAAQVAVRPPTIVLFCNEPKLVDQSWRRYLVNFLRDHTPYEEVPIQIHFRPRQKQPRPDAEPTEDARA